MQSIINELNKSSEQATDELAFSQLYDKYAPALYGRILSVVMQKEIADKILEKIFINAFIDKTVKGNDQLSFFINALNHSRSKSYKMLKAIRMFQACNCSLQTA